MINHFRTLLGNVPMLNDADLGTEYVPRDYLVRPLPVILQRMYDVLFGTKPDRAYINQRLLQYMQVMHATELEEYVRALDPRITYLPFDTDWYTRRCGTRITKTGADCRVFVSGVLQADDPLGHSLYRWRLAVTDATTVTVTQRLRGFTSQSLTPDVSRGLTEAIPLANSGLSVKLGTLVGGESDLSSIVGASVFIDGTARVGTDLSRVMLELDALMMGQTAGYLFVGEEPYKTFRNLWFKHPHMPYRLGAALAAYVYRLDSLVVKE